MELKIDNLYIHIVIDMYYIMHDNHSYICMYINICIHDFILFK